MVAQNSEVAVGCEEEPAWIPPSSSRLDRLLQGAKIYVYTVYYQNGNVTATRHSSGCQAVTGYSQEDYRRDPALWITMVHPEDREQVSRQVAAAELARQTTQIEHRVIHRDGTIRWVRNTIIPGLNGNELEYCDGLIEDVTDRKSVEGALMHQTMQLTAAQEIQRRLLPQRTPQIPGAQVAGMLIPAEYAAGDFYDYLTMRDGSPAFVIGDVSGHGFGPALLMSLTHTLVRVLTRMDTNLVMLFRHINDFLVRQIQEDRFVTLFYARYEPARRRITYASAGHPPAYVIDHHGHLKAKLVSTSLPLGVLSEATFTEVGDIQLDRNDTLLMLTDGILETAGPDRRLFGEARTLQLLQRDRGLPPRSILEGLHRELCEFSGQTVLADDVTAVILKVD
ncbi:MAG: PP2C family protein-serine/threonine phosphatase [Thermoguttaceae bacterium]